MTRGVANSIRILHVDDDPDLTELVATFLQREDDAFTVETATSVDEGRDRLAEQAFDCIVSDYEMPDKDGIEFLEAVRAEYPDLPFLLYTGKGSEEVASDAISAGVTDYMQKGAGTDQYAVLANRVKNSVEQYRAKAEAERHRQRLREITESTTDCRWMFTAEWDELLFVSGYEAVWGRPSSEIIENAQTFLNSVHPEDRERVRAAMDRVSNGDTVDIEYRISRDDGSTGWVWVKGEPVYDDSGDVVRAVGFTREITDRKEREQELKRTSEQMEFALQSTNAGVWEFDPESNRITSYPDPCPILNREVDTAADFFELIHSDDRARVQASFQSTIEAGETTRIEYRTIPEIEVEWVESQIKPITDDEGSVTQLTGLTRDITERKAYEQNLTEEREFIEQALDTLDDLFYVVGPDGEMQRWNEHVSDLTGYTDAEINDMQAVEFFPEDQREQVANAIEKALTDGNATVEADVRTKDGTRIPHELTGTYLTNADGTVTGFVGTGRDITERKEREQTLKRERDRLEEFASVVSHDLRNPLQVAEGRLKLAREECDSEHLDTIETALHRIDRITEDVLWLAQEGRNIGSMDSVAIRDAVDSTWNLVADAREQAELHYAGEEIATATIETDDDRFRQLLENLFSNAIEHGGEEVTVVVGAMDTGFYVEDDGPGIVEDRRDDVFTTGYSTGEDGTGFGLSIVEQVVEGHDWEIRVTEGSEGGARFEITGIEFTAE